jgi:hypothetical protein
MSRRIAVHLLAGIVFVAVGTARAQESKPRPAVVAATDARTSTGVVPTKNDSSRPKHDDVFDQSVPLQVNWVAGIDTDLGVTIEIAPRIHVDDPNHDIEGRQNSTRPRQDPSDSRQAKTGTLRRWFAAGATRMLEFLMGAAFYTSGRGPS